MSKRARSTDDGEVASLERARKQPRTLDPVAEHASAADTRDDNTRGVEGGSGSSPQDVAEDHGPRTFAFEVPHEWLKLAKAPCSKPLPDAVRSKFTQFVHGDSIRRQVQEKYGGNMGELQRGVTMARAALAEALQAHAEQEAQRHAILAGGADAQAEPIVPRKLGAYFQVDGSGLQGGADLAGLEVEPILVLVQKSVPVGKLEYATVDEALQSITLRDVELEVMALQKPKTKSRSRRKVVEPEEGWVAAAMKRLLKTRMHTLLHRKCLDVAFQDNVPSTVMKQYDALRGGEIPVASDKVMDAYRKYLRAKRHYEKMAATKKKSVQRANTAEEESRADVLQYMLANNLRSKFLNSNVRHSDGTVTSQKLYVQVKVRAPKVGLKPTVKWVLSELSDATQATEACYVASEEALRAFQRRTLERFRAAFAARAAVVVKPAEMYVGVCHAKTSTDTATRFDKVHM